MEKDRYKTRATVLILLAGMSAAIALTGDVVYDETMEIRPVLPGKAGEFTGTDIYYCQDASCSEASVPVLSGNTETPTSVCELCGGAMGTVAPVEQAMLPKDTVIVKKRYNKPDGTSLSAGLVISGKDRRSIHRPQGCLPAAGYRLGKPGMLNVPIAGGRSVSLRTIELDDKGQGTGGIVNHYCYAYWYTDGRRETCLQPVMMLWIVYDRTVYGRATRWSYISVQTPMIPGTDHHLKVINEFVSALYPQVIALPEAEKL